MAQNVELGGLIIEIGNAHMVVVVPAFKAQIPAQGHGLFQGGLGTGAEGSAGGGFPLHALHVHQPGDGGGQLFPDLGIVKIGVDLFLHDLHSFLAAAFSSASSSRYLYTVYRDTFSRVAT